MPSIVSAPVESGSPDESEKVRPTSELAKVTEGDGVDGQLTPDDRVQILFSEHMAVPDAGDSITLASGVTLTNGQGATFTLNPAGTTLGTVAAPRGHMLTITVDQTPGSTVSWPQTLFSHNGVTDLAGNTWDVNASDAKVVQP